MGTISSKQGALLTDCDTNSAYSIAYQTLYANIRFDWDSEHTRQHSILLATPAAYPGQITAVANVAIAAAQNGTPTVLVDSNLHTPALQQLFKVNAPTGLSDLLLANREITAQALASHLHETDVPRLRLLCAGKALAQPQDVGRLLTARLQDLLTSIRQYLADTESKPSLIIFNSPPVLAGIDAAQISALVDQTFLLIASGRTTRTQVRRAQEQLQRAHAHLLGIVMLDV
ncbi:MAG: hypothetical protein JOZ18_19935 [Chloroflexi bacterium]|nr:hypothetical protein [Chloroflexota bacterium]